MLGLQALDEGAEGHVVVQEAQLEEAGGVEREGGVGGWGFMWFDGLAWMSWCL